MLRRWLDHALARTEVWAEELDDWAKSLRAAELRYRYEGHEKTLPEWAAFAGLPYCEFWRRLKEKTHVQVLDEALELRDQSERD